MFPKDALAGIAKHSSVDIGVALVAEAAIVVIGRYDVPIQPALYVLVPLAVIGLWRIVSTLGLVIRVTGLSLSPIKYDSGSGHRFGIAVKAGFLPMYNVRLKITEITALADGPNDQQFIARQRKADGLRAQCLTVNDGATTKQGRELFDLPAFDETVVDLAHWRNRGGVWVLISEREFDSASEKMDRPQKAKLLKGKYRVSIRLVGTRVPLSSPLTVEFVVTDADVASVGVL